ncbi:hypothetical protein K435DRAFT_300756 [Dendrothele bispora CBS 962.96]|uniref:Mucoidy inhibitor A n=1 Tax=Dendrothele bispora (strain CBS 962.96) TaxID=1314807 RepID=A0A4S8LIW2_DENBC|nr:hypothetical protein K435DRAFT_300756 [Dendrothele bispora CBS 962.96]
MTPFLSPFCIATTMSQDGPSTSAPPAFEPHTIELDSVDAGKIINVSLYSGRAEVTRSYTFDVNTGQNQVVINGLPSVMDRDSLRVQGRGEATIQDVNVSDVTRSPLPPTPNSAELDRLLDQKQRAEKALDRCKKSLKSLETLFSTMHIQHVDVSQLGDIMDSYETTAEKLDDKVTALEKEIKELDVKIKEQRAAAAPKNPKDTGVCASIGIFAEQEGSIDLILVYAVSSAWWRAGYDIRVDMELKATPVTLIYKALVRQDTGESWENVPLTLETATPSYGFDLPTLREWKLSMYKPMPLMPPPPPAPLFAAAPGGAVKRLRVPLAKSRSSAHHSIEEEADEDGSFNFDAEAPAMAQASASVVSKGNVSATFKVPGLVNIPSGAGERSFTIVELNLGAAMSWIAVPKEEAKVALKAKIQNSSEYTMLPGKASVYVDGSFISKIDVPPVNPNENFECPLGLDPSIRIKYLPLQKIVSTTGFYTKTANYTYTQRIVVQNTKSVPINPLKIIDQIPVSEDVQINVKLMNPSLKPPVSGPSPGPSGSGGSPSSSTSASPVGSVTAQEGAKTTKRMSIITGPAINPNASPLPITPSYSKGQVPVGDGVIAQWDGSDDPTVDVEALGKNGKLNWLCEIPPLGTLNLSLQYEVNTPAKTTVIGL